MAAKPVRPRGSRIGDVGAETRTAGAGAVGVREMEASVLCRVTARRVGADGRDSGHRSRRARSGPPGARDRSAAGGAVDRRRRVRGWCWPAATNGPFGATNGRSLAGHRVDRQGQALGRVQPDHRPADVGRHPLRGQQRHADHVANATGTVAAAGWASSAPLQPGCGPRRAVTTRTAVAARPPPTTMPGERAGAVRPRHQMPSTSSGQKDEAATAKARPTASATARPVGAERQQVGADAAATRKPSRKARTGSERRQQVLAEHAGDRDRQAGRRGQEGREGAGRQQRGGRSSPSAAEHRVGQEHDGVGVRRQRAGRGCRAGRARRNGGQQVEQRRAARRPSAWSAGPPAVRVGVEADQDVRQAHRAEERRQDQRVRREESRAAPCSGWTQSGACGPGEEVAPSPPPRPAGGQQRAPAAR